MPVTLDPPPAAEPRTQPQHDPARPWWRRQFPWQQPKTRIAAPADDGDLLLDNRTDDRWSVHLGYRDLGPVAPRDRRTVRVVKSGLLTVRQVEAPVGTGYLTAHLSPAVQAVEIRHSLVAGAPFYDLRLIEGRPDAEAH